jgi:tyrosinase
MTARVEPPKCTNPRRAIVGLRASSGAASLLVDGADDSADRDMSTGAASPQQPTVPLRHRLSVESMSTTQLEAFRSAMSSAMSISDERGYNYQAGIHGLPLPISCDIAHGHPIFLPWHRAYLYFFELTLRDHQPDAMLPWWNWTVDRAIPEAYKEPAVAGKPNPLYSAKVDPVAVEQGAEAGDRKAPETVREPGAAGAPPLPTKVEVEAVLQLGSFEDFTGQLEQLHNNVHVWVGGENGHMGDIQLAAFDPIFWAHHTMIDRIWRMWQLRHPQAGIPRSLLAEALPPFNMTVTQTLESNALGYDYAVEVHDAGGTTA